MKGGRLSDRSGGYLRYFALYSLFFLIALGGVYYSFWHANISLLWGTDATGDGVRQHYVAFVYLGRWGRELLRSLFVTHTAPPVWSFDLGYGGDILTTLHYYGLGDPFNLVALCTPPPMAEYVLCALIPVRLYLSGIAFSCFCFRFDKSCAGTLCAALSYVFCGYALYAGARHPFFLNPMLYLPLLLLGTERVLKRERAGLLVITVFLSAVSSFYFYYLLVCFTVLYAIFRCIMLGWLQHPKELGLAVLRMGSYALIGTAMAAVILVPVILTFLGDNRLVSHYPWQLHYPLHYYEMLPGTFLTNAGSGSWTFLCFTPGVLLSICLLFLKRRQHYALKIAFLLLTAFLLTPACGRVLNGMSYPTNRWCWAYSMLSCYLLADLWPDLLTSTRRVRMVLAGFTGVFAFLVLLLPDCRTANTYLALLLMSAMLLTLFFWDGATGRGACLRTAVLLVLTLVSVICSAFFSFAPAEGNGVARRLSVGQAWNKVTETEDLAVKQAAKDQRENGFYRYSVCTSLSGQTNINSSLLAGLSSTKYYWSLSNGNLSQYLLELNHLEYSTYRYTGLDDRTGPLALAGVKYYAVPVIGGPAGIEEYLPCGYELAGQYPMNHSGPAWLIYRNRNALPLGYTYSGWMARDQYEALSPTEKQEALLQCAVLDESTSVLPKHEPRLTQRVLPFALDCGEGVTWSEEGFRVTEREAAVTLNFDGLPDSETDLCFEGLAYTGFPPKKKDPYWEEADTYTLAIQCNGVTKFLTSHTDAYTWYNNRTDFVVNLGYRKQAAKRITLTFSEPGLYTCPTLRLVCQPMNQYEQQTSALAADTLEQVERSSNRITGRIDLTESKLLCLSIPFSAGWTARVDGQEADLLRANTMYMALALPPGHHTIELRYMTPGLRVGILLSVFGWLAFLGVQLWSHRRRRKST